MSFNLGLFFTGYHYKRIKTHVKTILQPQKGPTGFDWFIEIIRDHCFEGSGEDNVAFFYCSGVLTT